MQRVPRTEKKGRRHSSVVTVVTMDQDTPTQPPTSLDERDLRFTFTRGTGRGGQRRNKVETVVIATHLPTGLSVRVEEERSQAANRAIAVQRIARRLAEQGENARHDAVNAERARAFDDERGWVWVGWRDEVKGPGRRASMTAVLKGRLDPLLS